MSEPSSCTAEEYETIARELVALASVSEAAAPRVLVGAGAPCAPASQRHVQITAACRFDIAAGRG